MLQSVTPQRNLKRVIKKQKYTQHTPSEVFQTFKNLVQRLDRDANYILAQSVMQSSTHSTANRHHTAKCVICSYTL